MPATRPFLTLHPIARTSRVLEAQLALARRFCPNASRLHYRASHHSLKRKPSRKTIEISALDSICRRISTPFSSGEFSSSSSSASLTPANPMLSGGEARMSKNERSYELLSTAKLGISEKHEKMFTAIYKAAMNYMYGLALDASHDNEH
jgi:hypothetical protein